MLAMKQSWNSRTKGAAKYCLFLSKQAIQDSTSSPPLKSSCLTLFGTHTSRYPLSGIVLIMYNLLTACQEQAIDRAHRIGQQKPVQVHRIIVENTVEDRILALQEKKRELIEAALDENASKSISRLGVRELGFLFVSPSNTPIRKTRADYVRMCLRDPSPACSLKPPLSSAHMPRHTIQHTVLLPSQL